MRDVASVYLFYVHICYGIHRPLSAHGVRRVQELHLRSVHSHHNKGGTHRQGTWKIKYDPRIMQVVCALLYLTKPKMWSLIPRSWPASNPANRSPARPEKGGWTPLCKEGVNSAATRCLPGDFW